MTKYAIIENGVCKNVIVAGAEFAEQIGAVLLAEGFGIGDMYTNGIWSKAAAEEPAPTAEERLTALEEAVLAMMEV